MSASRLSSEGWVKSLVRSLSLSLFIWVFGVIIVAFATHAVISIRSAPEKWNEIACECAQRFSDLIKHSTHYSLLETRLQEKTEELSRTQHQVAHMEKMASLGKLADLRRILGSRRHRRLTLPFLK